MIIVAYFAERRKKVIGSTSLGFHKKWNNSEWTAMITTKVYKYTYGLQFHVFVYDNMPSGSQKTCVPIFCVGGRGIVFSLYISTRYHEKRFLVLLSLMELCRISTYYLHGCKLPKRAAWSRACIATTSSLWWWLDVRGALTYLAVHQKNWGIITLLNINLYMTRTKKCNIIICDSWSLFLQLITIIKSRQHNWKNYSL